MSAAAPLIASVDIDIPRTDERLLLSVSWRDYCVLRDLLDGPGLRMTYLHGTLELMRPSREHESIKKRIARLVEMFAVERDVPLYCYGSTTFRKEAEERGLEPDECHCLGAELREVPDIAIEVVVTNPAINKLAVYRGLGVREVWFWKDGGFRLYALVDGAYAEIARSGLVAALDFAILAEYAARMDQPAAIREYRDRLRSGG